MKKFLIKKVWISDEYTNYELIVKLNIKVEIDSDKWDTELINNELFNNPKVIKKINDSFHEIFAKDNVWGISGITYDEIN